MDNPPLFVIRSVLGKNLLSICCISPQSTCPKCLYRQSCVYVFLFETILSQSNQVVPGRNRASRPFLLSGKMLPMKTQLSEYQFTVTLLGKGIEYLPYFLGNLSYVEVGAMLNEQIKIENLLGTKDMNEFLRTLSTL